jgi:transposase
MNKKLTLTECEAMTLLQLLINLSLRDARMRMAGLLRRYGAEHRTEIGSKLDASHQLLYNWLDARENGCQGKQGVGGGRTGGWSLAISEEIIATAVSVASQETLGKMLKRQSFSLKRMRMSLKNRDPVDFLPARRMPQRWSIPPYDQRKSVWGSKELNRIIMYCLIFKQFLVGYKFVSEFYLINNGLGN